MNEAPPGIVMAMLRRTVFPSRLAAERTSENRESERGLFKLNDGTASLIH
jgi:hypothetical protein